MMKEDFSTWTIPQLQDFLSKREINQTGNKATLVHSVFMAYHMNVPLSQQDYLNDIKGIEDERKKKLTLEGGQLVIKHPKMLSSDWLEGSCYFRDTTEDQVRRYLNSKHAGKAFKGVKSLLESGHLSNVQYHFISSDVRCGFVTANCLPEQRISNAPYDVWVCLHKDAGTVMSGECSCATG